MDGTNKNTAEALKATLDVWLPKGVELFVRPPMPIAGLPTAQAEDV